MHPFRDLRGCLLFGLIGALAAPPARADYDLSYDSLYSQTFTADQIVSFDDLVPGTVLEMGDPVAPGVTFGGVSGAVVEQALVVDAGGGDLELRSMNVGAPQQSRIAFQFASDVVGVGAVVSMTAGNSSTTFPLCEILDAVPQSLAFISVGGSVDSFFGWLGDETSRPTRFVDYEYAGSSPEASFGLDDLAILYVPEPASTAQAAAALAALASRRRRERAAAAGEPSSGRR